MPVTGDNEGYKDDLAEFEDHGVKVKVEKTDNQWVPPLYSEEPTIIFDGKLPISRKTFETIYGLHNKGKSPKRLKIGKDCTEAEVERLFGPCNGKNSYRYNYHEDEEVCKEVERLWMICHQRTVVPGSRHINKAEARGFTCMQKVPKPDINWAVFAEWCVRDRLRRIGREASKHSGGLGSLDAGVEVANIDSDVEEDTQCVKISLDRAGDDKRCVESMLLQSSRSRETVNGLVLEWCAFLSSLDKELSASDISAKVLQEMKEQSAAELLRADAQLADRQQLLQSASAKLMQIEAEIATMKANILDNPGLGFEKLPGAGPLLRRFDSQVGVLETFTEMLAVGEADQIAAKEKSESAVITYEVAMEKHQVLNRQRCAIVEQLRLLKAGHHLQTPIARPPQFGMIDSSSETLDCCFISHPCAYCNRPFPPEWDCKIASCRHGYHSWCANAHFSTSTVCCFKGCGEEMHHAWWDRSGIMKPTSVDEGSKAADGVCDIHNLEQPFFSVLGRHPIQPSRSGTASPSVGSKVFDMGKPATEPIDAKIPGRKRKEVEPHNKDDVVVLKPLLDPVDNNKRRRAPVKKSLPPMVDDPILEDEEYSLQAATEDDSSTEDEAEPTSPSPVKESSGGKRRSSGKKNKNDFGALEHAVHKTLIVEKPQGAEKPIGRGKKAKTPVPDRVSMAKTTRTAAAKQKS